MRRGFYATILILSAALTAAGQEVPKAEVFGGYSWVGGNFHGGDASVTLNLNRWLGLTANVSGHRGTERDGPVTERQSASSFLFGPRFKLRRKRAEPFAYALFGGVRFSATITAPGQTLSGSDTGFNMALGGGLDVRVNDRVAVRAFQLDYLRPHFFGESHNRGRLAAGVVFRFGRR